MEGIPSVEPFRKRIAEIDEMMNDPGFYQDQRRSARLGREHQKAAEIVRLYDNLAKTVKDKEDNEALIGDSSADPELVELAKEELEGVNEAIEEQRGAVLREMIPPDQSDSRNTIIEIRAGTGGDEASLFAGVLYRMYSKYAEKMGWKVEPMSSSSSGMGGYREVSFLVSGEDVYKRLKLESGVHRVQRVPTTETMGRVHTSTATVAVLPEAEEVDIEIKPDDLEISVCRASGPGGQGVNTTDSAVQLRHKPTGVMVYCADERSQLKNKLKAMAVLRSRLLQAKEEEERAKYAAERKNQVGSGDRSERIRTYNFPQNRITDHRIGLTLHNLPEFIEGDIDEALDALQRADQEAKVQTLLEKNAE